MIQRIQSIYLLLIAVIMSAMLFFSATEIFPTQGSESLSAPQSSISSFLHSYVVPGLIIATVILVLLSLFNYKKRLLQIKICNVIRLSLGLIMGVILFSYIEEFVLKSGVSYFSWKTNVMVIFLLIALILDIMTINRIKKDEQLVRSADRIR